MKIKIVLCSLLLVLSYSLKVQANAIDSVGIKTVEGKKFIIHKLEPKETLYGLSRRYHVSVQDITNANSDEKEGYAIDQIGRELLIPLNTEFFNTSPTSKDKTNSKQHQVSAGETIYSISSKYKVSQENLMKWNNLESPTLSIGQKLWVANPAKFPGQSASTPTDNEDVSSSENLIHTVDLGETIYSLSKKYEVSQSQIIELNNLANNDISVGQKLIIKKGQEEQPEKMKESEPQQTSLQTFHNASKGETYYIVSNMYGVPEKKLKKWNSFKEPFMGGEVIKIVEPEAFEQTIVKENEKVDQSKMHTVKSGETLYSLSEKYKVDVEELRKWNALDNYQLSLGQKIYISNPDALPVNEVRNDSVKKVEVKGTVKLNDNPQKKDTKTFFTVEEDEIPKIDKVIEKGVAEVIEGSESTEKHLALHRTAKIGTIVQVRNDLNDQIVFVRVLGKLPNTGVDEKVIIRISKKAFEKLGGVDYKFPVEISYLPLKD